MDIDKIESFFSETSCWESSCIEKGITPPEEALKNLESIDFSLIKIITDEIKILIKKENIDPSDFVSIWIFLAILLEAGMKCFIAVYAEEYKEDKGKTNSLGINKLQNFIADKGICNCENIHKSIDNINSIRNSIFHNSVPIFRKKSLSLENICNLTKIQKSIFHMNELFTILENRLPF